MRIKRTTRTELNYEGFEKYLHCVITECRPGMHDIQYVFKFENGYGASVIKSSIFSGSKYNLWEVAVLKFDEEDNYEITYDTQITDDTIGFCQDSKVRVLLEDIKSLKKRKIS